MKRFAIVMGAFVALVTGAGIAFAIVLIAGNPGNGSTLGDQAVKVWSPTSTAIPAATQAVSATTFASPTAPIESRAAPTVTPTAEPVVLSPQSTRAAPAPTVPTQAASSGGSTASSNEATAEFLECLQLWQSMSIQENLAALNRQAGIDPSGPLSQVALLVVSTSDCVGTGTAAGYETGAAINCLPVETVIPAWQATRDLQVQGGGAAQGASAGLAELRGFIDAAGCSTAAPPVVAPAPTPVTVAPAVTTRTLTLTDLDGAAILIADDGKFIGNVSSNRFDSDSICNEFGDYGSKFSSTSIRNEFSQYGSKFSSISAYNQFSSSPPAIVYSGQIVGHLTKNEFQPGAVDPDLMLAVYGCPKD